MRIYKLAVFLSILGLFACNKDPESELSNKAAFCSGSLEAVAQKLNHTTAADQQSAELYEVAIKTSRNIEATENWRLAGKNRMLALIEAPQEGINIEGNTASEEISKTLLECATIKIKNPALFK